MRPVPAASDLEARCPICWTPTATRPPEDIYRSVVDGQVYIREHLLQWLAHHERSPATQRDAQADIVQLWPPGARGPSPRARARMALLHGGLDAIALGCQLGAGAVAVLALLVATAIRPRQQARLMPQADRMGLVLGLIGATLAARALQRGLVFFERRCGQRTVANAWPPVAGPSGLAAPGARQPGHARRL